MKTKTSKENEVKPIDFGPIIEYSAHIKKLNEALLYACQETANFEEVLSGIIPKEASKRLTIWDVL